MTYEVPVGSFWSLPLPKPKHESPGIEVFYTRPRRGKASQFMTYDQEQSMLVISANATTAFHIGEYPIDLQLIDVEGILSDKLTITVRIVPVESATEKADSKSTKES